MSQTCVYRLRVRTDTDDKSTLLLLADNKLVAILVKLADECHGDERGKWMIEKTFGLGLIRVPDTFASAAEGAAWVSEHICNQPFALGSQIRELR